MTYGWAILVVLITIGALAYFGVLNPERFIPDMCSCEYTEHEYQSMTVEEYNSTVYDCFSIESYIDYDKEMILFNQTHKLYRCVNKTMEMV